MGTKKKDFKSLSEEFAGAKENVDLSAFVKVVLEALGKSEEEIAAALLQITELGTENKNIQLKLDDQTALLIAAKQQIVVLDTQNSANIEKIAAFAESDIRIAELEKENDETLEQLQAALTEVASLGTQLHIREAGAGKSGLLVAVDGVYHRLHGNSFSFKDEEGKLTATDVAKRPDLLNRMKESQSGALVLEEVN